MSRFARKLGLFVVLLVPLACAGAGGKGANGGTNVPQGDMPAGTDWTGVYYSQTYGNLHLIEQSGSVSGKWRTANGDSWGELAGEPHGDVLRYEWTEHKIGMVGPSATTKGRGYFKYKPSGNGVDPDEIKGEWGMGEKDSGYTWSAVKQRNVKPDPDSVRPDELEKRGQGGGWDSEGGQAKPKAKKPAEEETGGGEQGGGEEGGGEPPKKTRPTTGSDSEY